MLHKLAARAFMMIGAGATAYDAIAWVVRRFGNLKRYWFRLVLREVMGALA